MNVALYARVSTEEQAKHGISIDAQIAALRLWAQEQGHTVVGEFVDNGVSARKAPSKRPALQSLLAQIQTAGIELIAFTKLDRWTRNVKGYYQVQEVLDRHKVAWTAIQEDYETITASGRFKTNIMLSVAENEADRTSERIKAVFDHKIAMGQPVTQSLPLGLKLDGKRIVHDEFAPAAIAAFEHYAAHGNKTAVRNMLSDEYGIHISITSVSNLLHNPLYIGEYRGNKQFCEPLVPADLFARVQHDLAARSTRKTPSGRAYLFSGLIICTVCGRRMAVIHKGEGRDYYRCSCGHGMYHDCTNRHYIREQAVEDAALNALYGLVKGARVECHPPQKRKQTASRDAVRRKLDRLTELYVDGDITKEVYIARRDAMNAQMEEPAPQTMIRTLDGDNFLTDYAQMDREQKKAFWRSVIDRIEIGEDGSADIFFVV